MNDEKLKKNMAEILFPVLKESRVACNEENACERCWFPCEVDRLADSLADALIAAGIGDVKKAEHRAEVAERALEILNDYECLSNPIRYYMKQAEKELQEEK